MMTAIHDSILMGLFGGVLCLLVILTVIGRVLKRRHDSNISRSTIDNFNAQISAWWKMCVVLALALVVGRIGSLVLFGILSFLALREYLTLVPTRRGDHRTLFWSFFVIMPLQYCVLGFQLYIVLAIMIPILACIFIPTSIAIAGDTAHFVERAAKIQFGLMVCGYCLSHACALLQLKIPGFEGHPARLLLYLGIVDQMNDLLQYVWGKLIGKNKIAWRVSPDKTWEGALGGLVSATALGTLLWWATPFTPLQSAGMSFTICILGFAGALVMSAIKRDIGIKDFGAVVERRGGILDRIDSLCFAAPIFFHLVRYYFAR
ncbi:MAG TPA: phosphatidate cytidylyltransferase [Candidatus Sulfotelmatobacter sp.]|jgi:phosphatidate cytidylyltransferase|nr:phosphatidate cytidylyltransferase [Candidatus Sulfotelmatobacter sp.]